MAIKLSTMSRLRCRTRPMSIAVGPVTVPNLAAWRTRSATFALQISFLLGRQLMFGQDPPINFRSTTAVRRPDLAMFQARYLPPSPLPRMRTSYCLGWDMLVSFATSSGLPWPNLPWRHPLQDSVPHDERVKQNRPEVSKDRQEKEGGDD